MWFQQSRSNLQYLIPPVLAVLLFWLFLGLETEQLTCHQNHFTNEYVCKPQCNHGYFGLESMDECHPWLTCAEISQLKVHRHIGKLGQGAVKMVYMAKWSGHHIAYNVLLTPEFKDDFHHGLTMLQQLQPHPEVTQFLGYCKNTFITEYHPLGDAYHFIKKLNEPSFVNLNKLSFRFEFCINYAKVIHFLHNSPIGTRVMCDSNDLKKTLSQFLVTSDLNLIANDLEALPKVNKSNKQLIKCGHRQLHGDFVAPEQLWPYPWKEFSDFDMPEYDEKTDIWKIPNVCEYFIGNVSGSDSLKFYLFKIHKQCKNIDPSSRPNALNIINEYITIKKEFDIR